ncbi:Hypothetical predicted protein [Paramuricea clavata]|uniref:Uncharacterized protein n=1 Tax=Paramuricea clavata TaxID=317549 RepID=A0A7D9EVR4_PARCT|nr:Hypothetical predicted protein [Paramuricea clavata]
MLAQPSPMSAMSIPSLKIPLYQSPSPAHLWQVKQTKTSGVRSVQVSSNTAYPSPSPIIPSPSLAVHSPGKTNLVDEEEQLYFQKKKRLINSAHTETSKKRIKLDGKIATRNKMTNSPPKLTGNVEFKKKRLINILPAETSKKHISVDGRRATRNRITISPPKLTGNVEFKKNWLFDSAHTETSKKSIRLDGRIATRNKMTNFAQILTGNVEFKKNWLINNAHMDTSKKSTRLDGRIATRNKITNLPPKLTGNVEFKTKHATVVADRGIMASGASKMNLPYNSMTVVNDKEVKMALGNRIKIVVGDVAQEKVYSVVQWLSSCFRD